MTTLCLLAVCSTTGCGVDTQGEATGGVASEAHGFSVINSDYQSASVSLLDTGGQPLSAHFISSGSADTGLSAALSGDVVFPTSPAAADEIVLIDRSLPGVISWVDKETARVRAQLNVSTGFFANPHDYVAFSPNKAFVTRFQGNPDSGKQAFDEGNDLLVVDPSVPEIVSRIDLTPALAGEAPEFLPSVDRALLASGMLRVLALGFNRAFTDRVASRLVSIDPEDESIRHVLVFDGLNSCSNLTPAPDGTRLYVACNGAFGQDPLEGFLDSGVVVVDVAGEPRELARFGARDLGGEMIASVALAGHDTLLFTSFGRFSADLNAQAAPDRLWAMALETGELSGEPLLESQSLPFSLGGLGCAPEIGVCIVADAETEGGVIHRFEFDAAGGVEAHERVKLDPSLGLPPRYIGRF